MCQTAIPTFSASQLQGEFSLLGRLLTAHAGVPPFHPALCGASLLLPFDAFHTVQLVELRGFEPLTSTVRLWRSPN